MPCSPSPPLDPNALMQPGPDHALIGGVVAVVVFITLCFIIVVGRYLARHKGTTSLPSRPLTYSVQNASTCPLLYRMCLCDLCGTVWTGTYLTNEAKGAEDAPDADTAIINAEGNHAHAEEKKEYFI